MRRTSLLFGASALSLVLAGCGGGGGSRPTPLPPAAPAPAPPPTPAPSPSPGNFDDLEYRNSNSVSFSGAIAAYTAGATGRGVKIAVVDSGINPNLPEFAGRIDPASADVRGNRGIVDTEGHGTSVTAVAAAARNGAGIQGFAFDSTILSFNSSDPRNCDDDGCRHDDRDIARGVDLSRTNGARVINISLGGSPPSSELVAALGRATQAGIVVVFSAGNESAANPDPLAIEAARQVGNGLMLIAGAYSAGTGDIADFSNRAGTGANLYILALGERVRSFDETGREFLYSGTSYAAPAISGAVALLASAFPNLSGSQIVELLLSTAQDINQDGTDPIYGRGLLNLTRAFQPQGPTSLAGSAVPVAIGETIQTSAAMGDATGSSAGAIILDGFSRPFVVEFASRMRRAAQDRPLAQSLHGDVRSAGALAGPASVSLTVRRDAFGQPQVGLAQTGLSYEDARQARAIAGMALGRVTPALAVAFGFAESGRTLQQRLAGHRQNAFLVARDPLTRTGFYADHGASVGLRHEFGPLGLTVTSESGDVHDHEVRQMLSRPGYSIASLTADRRIGPATLSLGVSRLQEEATVLGGRFGSAFGAGGATSWFADSMASVNLGNGWGAYASYRRGRTSMATGALATAASLATDAWSLDLSRGDAIVAGDRAAVRLMQPLRVAAGGIALNLPISYDYRDGGVGYEARFFTLAPTGREVDLEAAYSLPLWGGDLGLNAFFRRQPGHIAAADDDAGAALRFTLGF